MCLSVFLKGEKHHVLCGHAWRAVFIFFTIQFFVKKAASSTIATLCRRLPLLKIVNFFLGNGHIAGRFYFSLVLGDLNSLFGFPD